MMADRTSLYEPDALLAEARRQRAQVESLAGALDDDDFARRPEEGRWSVGECVEHLALINGIYLDSIDDAAAKARTAGVTAAGSKRPGRHGRIGDAFVRSLEPPPARLKGSAFRRTVPERRAKADVVRMFVDAQDRLIRTLDSVRDLDLARARMRSPFVRLLGLSLGQAFGAILAHNRRHIWQAEGVLALLRTNPQRRD